MRLPFGVNVSGDAVQRKTDEIYNPLPNVIGITDDIIIWGDKEDGSDHDVALARFLQVTHGNGLRINFDKSNTRQLKLHSLAKPIPPKGTNQPVTKYKPLPKCQLQPMSLNYRHS